MCGEKARQGSGLNLILGSPPHVRGKEMQVHPAPARAGITPACAGKSVFPKNPLQKTWDHPRMCGEKTKKIP